MRIRNRDRNSYPKGKIGQEVMEMPSYCGHLEATLTFRKVVNDPTPASNTASTLPPWTVLTHPSALNVLPPDIHVTRFLAIFKSLLLFSLVNILTPLYYCHLPSASPNPLGSAIAIFPLGTTSSLYTVVFNCFICLLCVDIFFTKAKISVSHAHAICLNA
jgi:hypothetical protein